MDVMEFNEAFAAQALIFKHLIETFDALGYSEPEIETEIVLLLIDDLWKGFVSEKFLGENCKKITMLLKKKYEF